MPLTTTTRRTLGASIVALAALLSPHGALKLSAATPITIIDDHHVRVVLPRAPRRIVALAPSAVEILYAIGAGDRVVGVSQGSDYPAAAAHKPVVLTYTGANLEKIVALHPDLLVAAGIDASYVPKLRTLHLPIIMLDPGTIPGVLHDMTIAGVATGTSARANAVVARLQARIAAVTLRVRKAGFRPRTYYEYYFDKSGGYTYGRNSFGDALITMAGGYNVGAAGVGLYPTLSVEELVAVGPQIIVLGDAAYGTTIQGVRARPGFTTIPAVQLRHIYPFNDTLVSRPGPRIVDGLEQMAHLLHPELFTQ